MQKWWLAVTSHGKCWKTNVGVGKSMINGVNHHTDEINSEVNILSILFQQHLSVTQTKPKCRKLCVHLIK